MEEVRFAWYPEIRSPDRQNLGVIAETYAHTVGIQIAVKAIGNMGSIASSLKLEIRR